jgi:hypothetical protein
VYRTTAEQLYQDYQANVVAIRTKVGVSRVRVTGTVEEIDQDATERPVLKLWTGEDSSAAMRLTEDQRAAAAQLAKDEAVEVECDRIGHNGAVPEGVDCILTSVDVMSRQVNLALFVANDNGTTSFYVVGPMSESACLAQGDGSSAKIPVSDGGEYVVWSGCTNATRESIPPGGCRLNESTGTIEEMPSAHLWRYDCASANVAHTSGHKKTAAGSHRTAAGDGVSPHAASATGTEPARGNVSERDGSQGAAVSKTGKAPPPPQPAASLSTTAAIVAGVAAASGSTAQADTGYIRLASAGDPGAVIGNPKPQAPAGEAAVAHSAQGVAEGTASSPGNSGGAPSQAPSGTADDLGQVRSADPQAADHIATYCSKLFGSSDRSTQRSQCRRSEAEAWTRLIELKEFPTLDEATLRKCSEPPYPDTYVAKESCARYELATN